MPERLKQEGHARWHDMGSGGSREEWSGALAQIQSAIESVTPPVPLSAEAAVCFAAMLDVCCPSVGALTHSSSSRELFTNAIDLIGLEAFHDVKFREHLMFRPMFGLFPNGLPSWGGLRKGELKALLDAYQPLTTELDEDEQMWHNELINALYEANASGEDIITLYM
jgi:hypothetical protein